MLEEIIRAPIFYQICLFGGQIAVILFQIEMVPIGMTSLYKKLKKNEIVVFEFSGHFPFFVQFGIWHIGIGLFRSHQLHFVLFSDYIDHKYNVYWSYNLRFILV